MPVRRGSGRIRHIASPSLWEQKLTQNGKVEITKIPGASNPVDLGTKHLDRGSIRRALEKCHCYVREGRSGIALPAEMREITRRHPEVFTFDDAVNLTRIQKQDCNLYGNDGGSSDGGGTGIAAGPNDEDPA